MKNKNNLIKKIKNGLKLAVATALIATSLTSCGALQDYTSQEEIIQAAETFDCDTSYLMKDNNKFIRMKHNDGEPIYVCFDNAYTEDLKDKAKESLDYIFGIVVKINSNYHYKIVNEQEFHSKLGKTKIYYTFGEHVSTYKQYTSVAQGHLEMNKSLYNWITNNPVYSKYEVNINKDKLKDRDDESVIYTFNHELLHTFGLGDVYTNLMNKTTDKHYGNTFMNNDAKLDRITPNDLACLISLYAPKMAVEENSDLINNYKKLVEDYEKYITTIK